MRQTDFILTQEALNLSKVIVQTRGMNALKTKFFTVPESTGQADKPDIVQPGQVSAYLLNSLVFDTVTFMGNNPDGSISYFDLTTQAVVNVPKMQLPIALCEVTKVNNVVKSNVAGRNGSVKQYISTGDYQVTIRSAFTTGIADKYPAEAMRQLQKITSSTTEVKVASNFLNLFGIQYLVFDECRFIQDEKNGRDVQNFDLMCTSEQPFTLKVLDGQTTSNDPFGNTIV